MLKSLRILLVVLIASLTVGPASAATSSLLNQTISQTTTQQVNATVSGSVKDTQGGPVAGAAIVLAGTSLYKATSDVLGAFKLTDIVPGVYRLTISKAGFNGVTQDTFVVTPGTSQQLAVVLQVPTLTTLHEIGSVTAVGRGTFNTSTASVANISAQTFVTQAQPQVMNILDQTPGIVASYPAVNGASPGAITFPNIRGALSFETASLIDGHPISVGRFGDYVTTFLSSYVLGGVELVKGPGADAPVTNYAIGGTVNFRTKDPTFKPLGSILAGFDNFGGSTFNGSYTGTAGKLGWAFDFASYDTPGPVTNYPALWVPNGGTIAGSGVSVDGQDYAMPAPPGVYAPSVVNNNTSLVACCQVLNTKYSNTSELAKLQFHFSPVTVGTFSYLGGQTVSDQGSNLASQTMYTFDPSTTQGAPPNSPPAPYTGSLQPGNQLLTNLFAGQDVEYNNEPIFQAEVRTTLGNDNILVRGYTAAIKRLTFQGGDDPTVPLTMNEQLYGTAYDGNGNPVQTFNGQMVPIQFFGYYHQFEQDKLTGYSAEYDHNIGRNQISLAYDHTHGSTYAGVYAADSFDPKGFSLTYNVPDGSSQDFGTFLLRGIFNMGDKYRLTLSNYLNTYQNTFAVNCVGGCPRFFGSKPLSFIFKTTNSSHYDGRVGLEYRPSSNVAMRFAFGSAIAPPYIGLLTRLQRGLPTYNKTAGYGLEFANSPTIQPETAFGYDLGGDIRSRDGHSTLAFDLYTTTLYNQFISQTSLIGTCTPTANARNCIPGTPGSPGSKPLFATGNTNLTNSRYRGLELSYRHDPAFGFGYTAQGALQNAYPYNLSPCFYYAGPCGVGSPSTNLAVLPNQNFYAGVGGGANGVSNQSIPYSQAYLEGRYRFKTALELRVGGTLFGRNNSLNQPAFWTANGAISVPFQDGATLEIAGDNLFNAHAGQYPLENTGVPTPLANGMTGLTLGNVIGPRRITVQVRMNVGSP